MIYNSTATVSDLIPRVPDTPAQIYFLHMGKECIIKSSNGVKNRGPYQETGSRSPENCGIIVILSPVLFQVNEHSAPAKWISQRVNVSTCSPGIFKRDFIYMGENLRLTGCDTRIILQERQQWIQPSLRNFNVRIQD